MSRRPVPCLLCSTSLVLVGAVSTGNALADAASYLFVGGGAAQLSQAHRETVQPMLLQLDLGMGTSPYDAFSFGGILRGSTYFGEGLDLALLQRTATRGYTQGRYGLALDLGASQRWWGQDSTSFEASLNGGGPWGLTLGLNAGFGTNDVMTFGLVVGIDWARFTVHRRSGESLWPNYPLPLGGDDVAAVSR